MESKIKIKERGSLGDEDVEGFHFTARAEIEMFENKVMRRIFGPKEN
jgi:hypothetical protein